VGGCRIALHRVLPCITTNHPYFVLLSLLQIATSGGTPATTALAMSKWVCQVWRGIELGIWNP
jgi:hypothetical protein